MPKRKVTFQGVGEEDDEDEISVPKKKVRGPDSCILRRSEGRERTRSQKRKKGAGGKESREGASFSMFSGKWVWRISSWGRF